MEKNTILINKKILEKRKEIEINGDIIVPDSKPDILSITVTNTNSYITKEEISDGKYRFDGIANTNIIYLSDTGENQSIQTELSFMEVIEDPMFTEKTKTKYKINVINVETKIVNERKVNLILKLQIYFEFYENVEVEYLNQIDSFENIECLKENVEVNTVVVQNQINTSLQEELILDGNRQITSILKSSILVDNIENKISYNKVLSKGDVDIKILYLNQELKPEIFETTVPIMNFIDMEKITEEEQCDINYKMRNMSLTVNSQEKNKINCKIEFEVFCIAYKKQEITVIQDMYGLNKKITFTSKKIEIQASDEIEKEVANINENVLIEDIREIYDVDVRSNIVSKTISENTNDYEGEVLTQIYYGKGNTLNVKEIKFPFVFKMKSSAENININFSRKRFKLNNENVAIDLEIESSCLANKCKSINVISEIQEEENENEDEYSMIVYFVKPGDTIWKIAKEFRVSMDDLIKINNLTDGGCKIYPGDKLYILK